MRLRTYFIGLVVILLLPLVSFGLPKILLHAVWEGTLATQKYDLWLARNMNPGYPFLWSIIAFTAVVAAVWSLVAIFDGDPLDLQSRKFKMCTGTGVLVSALVLTSGLIQWGGMVWNNKDFPRFYNQATTFVVKDIDKPPPSLQRLLEGASVGKMPCERVGKHDVPSCISSGTFPSEGWENRSASLAGAVRVMSQASGGTQKVDLLTETTAHIYPPKGESVAANDTVSSGYWTAIRDGSGIRIPTEAIVEWDGVNKPTSCDFSGENEFNRALRGKRSNNLHNLVADRFPKLRYNRSDVYGYCDREKGNRPVMVIPVFRNVRSVNRSVEVPAGVLLVRGSPSGDPRFEYKASVQEGEVPGPVYPLSIAETQRGEHTWAAGREYESRGKFGFEKTRAATQEGNSTEFLLRSRKDGRTYWVSPLTPRGSDSQLVLAYTVIPADTVTSGQLNQLTVYAQDRDDKHVVNLDQMERDIRDFVQQRSPGFFGANGRIQEFTPASGTSWRAFGVIDGDPRFVVSIDPNAGNTPVISNVRGSVPVTQPPGAPTDQTSTGTDPCSQPLSQATNQQLVTCAKAALSELEQRQAAPTG